MLFTKNLSCEKLIFYWLLGTCFLLWLMIMLGGATRLTNAGLSIVEWKPLLGVIPPLSEGAWIAEFEKYKLFPEYQQVHFHMSLEDFKFIYGMEYAHRLLGRAIGIFFFIPLGIFWVKGWLNLKLKKSFIVVTILGLAQGGLGWYMVKSGLLKDPHVSHYRLTAHLLLALLIMSILFWNALGIKKDKKGLTPPISLKNRLWVHGTAFLVLLTITYGGFVAGLKAGKIYNTYPLMGGHFLPSEWNFYEPFFLNFLENPATVQWVHRTLALITLTVLGTAMLGLLFNPQASSKVRFGALSALILGCIQVVLGILTLLFEVPVSLGTLHQGVGVLLLMGILYVMESIKPLSFEEVSAKNL